MIEARSAPTRLPTLVSAQAEILELAQLRQDGARIHTQPIRIGESGRIKSDGGEIKKKHTRRRTGRRRGRWGSDVAAFMCIRR